MAAEVEKETTGGAAAVGRPSDSAGRSACVAGGPEAKGAAAGDERLQGHVIVCGLGHVGYRIVCLLARLGQPAAVIARHTHEEWRLPPEAEIVVIEGDARDERLLERAGLARARAIVAVTDDDLANVAIALDARRLRPELFIVVRLFDQGLAAHLESSGTVDRAFSASALAAPAFAAAVWGATVHGRFEAAGESWIIEQCRLEAGHCPTGETIGSWAAPRECAVVAVQRGGEIRPRPSGSEPIVPGDRLAVVGTAANREKIAPFCGACGGGRPAAARWRRLTSAVRGWWHDMPGALRKALVGLLAVVLLSIGVFHTALGLPVVDALYFVVTTITTVGYGDYSLKDAPVSMKLFGTVLMLCGAAIMAVLFSIVTDLILRTRLRDLLARGCAECEGHVIVAGLGNIGFRLARDLAGSGEAVVAIELQEDGPFVQAAREVAPVVLGNARTEETLRRAGLAGAKAVVAATDDDLANLSIALATKRSRGDCRVVLRMFDSALAEKMQHGLPIDAALSVSAAAAPTFVGAVLCPGLLQGLLLEDCLVLIFHRPAGERPAAEAGVPAAEGWSEFALFARRPGQAGFAAVTPESSPGAADEVIAARCHRLQPRKGQP